MVQAFGRFQTRRVSQFVSELNPEVYKRSSVKFKADKKKKKARRAYSGFKSASDIL